MKHETNYNIYKKLRDQMEARGLWLEIHRYRALKEGQRIRGEKLKKEIAFDILNGGLAGSDAAAKSFSGFRARAPQMLSFGYDISTGFHSLLANPVAREGDSPAPTLGALFNLGISLFDRICDKGGGSREYLSAAFNEELLRSLINDSRSHQRLSNVAAAAPHQDVQALFKLISTFFALLERSTRLASGAALRGELSELLVAAYSAQMRCSEAKRWGTATLAEASEAKSTLPFVILVQLVFVCDCSNPGVQRTVLDLLTQKIAAAFWLIDDLVDLISDSDRGDVNIIILRQQMSTAAAEEIVDAAIEDSLRNLFEAKEILTQFMHGDELTDSVLTYAQRWISRLSRQPSVAQPDPKI